MDVIEGITSASMYVFVDDFVIITNNKSNNEIILKKIDAFLNERGCKLNLTKTKVTELSKEGEYVDFVGYRFIVSRENTIITTVGKGQSRKFTFIQGLTEWFRTNESKRRNQTKLGWRNEIMEKVNAKLRGHMQYFIHVDANDKHRQNLHYVTRMMIRKLSKRLRVKAKLFYFSKGGIRPIQTKAKKWKTKTPTKIQPSRYEKDVI
jgi:hypothetical protein